MKDLEVLNTEKVLLVLPKGLSDKTIPFDFAIKNINKPFIIFGLPKKIKNYIKKNAICIEEQNKTKFPKYKALVQSPVVGSIIDLSDDKQNVDKWFEEGVYVMSLEEAEIYKSYFNSNYFVTDDKYSFILNALNK